MPLIALLLLVSTVAPETAATTQFRAATTAEKAALATLACQPRPPRMDTPRYPPSAARRGLGGVVHVRVTTDPCGVVRFADIGQSSGDRAIDLAALRNMAGAVLVVPDGHEGILEGSVPVSFEPPTLDYCPSFERVTPLFAAASATSIRAALSPDPFLPFEGPGYRRAYLMDANAQPVLLVEFVEASVAPGPSW